MAAEDVRRWYQARQDELRAIVWEWDPIGLAGAPQDEYDCVVDGLLGRLSKGSTANDLGVYLERELEEHFGTAGAPAPQKHEHVAERILAWYKAAPELPRSSA